MCGRFLLTVEGKTLEEYFGLGPGTVEHRPRYNIAPGQEVPVILLQDRGHVFSPMRWGFLPRWAKEERSRRPINARAETVDRLPFFRESFRLRRCLIPADGFYEWQGTGRLRRPFCIRLPGGALFAFAGIWDHRVGTGGVKHSSCCIITTAANGFMREIHRRMPVLLADREVQEAWLDPATPGELLRSMMRPYEGEMVAYPVSGLVNSPGNDSPECLRTVDAKGERPEGGPPPALR